MQLKSVMTYDVEVIHPNATLEEAAAKMDALDVGPLPVADGKHLVGMVTDRDITVRAVAAGKDPRTTQVREVMTDRVVYCFEDQDTNEAARVMQEQQIRRLLILDRDQQLVGIVSLGDLAVATQDNQLAGEILERVSELPDPTR